MTKHIHMMGIGGSGIAGVAKLAEKLGYSVTGCDLEDSTAYAKNIYKGHDPKHLEGVDLLVVSPAVLYQNANNSELVEGQKKGIALTWQEFVGKYLMKGKKVICIAGTHGKSTTTVMAGKLLEDAGLDPTVLVGATVPEWYGNARFGFGKYFIIEADEFNNNFLNYHPDIAIINNIEFDHPDFFKNEKEVKKSFDKFIKNLKGDKILITEKDSQKKHFNLKLFGEHNQKNANMVFVLGKKLGISDEVIIKSLESFEGIGRRMELIADKNGVKVYDDYAHHPTAIKTTLEGVREKFPNAKILVIDEPHGYKRTKALVNLYKNVFTDADKVIIGPIFQARDEIDESISPQIVADVSNHKNIEGFDSYEKLIENCKLIIGNYNVIVVMGAGKSYLWAREIAEALPINFSDLTTFKIGGKIENYFEVKNRKEIDKAVDFARSHKLPIFILGGGSDILAADKTYKGVVIKYIRKGYNFNEGKGIEFTGFGGTNWDKFVASAVDKELSGLECLSGIPGTVGAAPVQNIGAYGAELKDHFKSLKAYDLKTKKFKIFSKEDCKFGYRESIFKTKNYWQRYLITEVTFLLKQGGKIKVNYESLKGVVNAKASTKEIRNAVLKVRSEKLENPLEHGNAGSFFMNPIIDVTKKQELEEKYPEVKIYPFEGKFKISAGWLIEKAGLKEKEFGGAAVSSKHALILINKSGKATSDDVYKLSEMIIDEVNKKFGIKLEREVQLINYE